MALAFPYLADWFGSHHPFFFVAAGLNVAALIVWSFIQPQRALEAGR